MTKFSNLLPCMISITAKSPLRYTDIT